MTSHGITAVHASNIVGQSAMSNGVKLHNDILCKSSIAWQVMLP